MPLVHTDERFHANGEQGWVEVDGLLAILPDPMEGGSTPQPLQVYSIPIVYVLISVVLIIVSHIFDCGHKDIPTMIL